MAQWLRDWWRGYSDEDLRSVCLKMHDARKAGGLVPVTLRELKAWNTHGVYLLNPTNGKPSG